MSCNAAAWPSAVRSTDRQAVSFAQLGDSRTNRWPASPPLLTAAVVPAVRRGGRGVRQSAPRLTRPRTCAKMPRLAVQSDLAARYTHFNVQTLSLPRPMALGHDRRRTAVHALPDPRRLAAPAAAAKASHRGRRCGEVSQASRPRWAAAAARIRRQKDVSASRGGAGQMPS